MKRTILLTGFCFLILALGFSGTTKADLISHPYPFDLGTSANPSFDFLGITPFDTSFGTLDQVIFSIEGILMVTIVDGGYYDAANSRYFTRMISGIVEQDIYGLNDQFFEFGSPTKFSFGYVNTGGIPGRYTTVKNYNYSFSFTETTDLAGFTTVSSMTGDLLPPTSINGLRSDFFEPFVPINEIDILQLVASVSPDMGPPNVSSTSTSAGSIIIQYDYTPTPIPEPSTILLLGSSLVALAGFGRKKLFKK